MTEPTKTGNFLHVCKSVLSSLLGVQSAQNREQDFAKSSFVPFAVVGVLMVLLLIGGLILLVNAVVSGLS